MQTELPPTVYGVPKDSYNRFKQRLSAMQTNSTPTGRESARAAAEYLAEIYPQLKPFLEGYTGNNSMSRPSDYTEIKAGDIIFRVQAGKLRVKMDYNEEFNSTNVDNLMELMKSNLELLASAVTHSEKVKAAIDI